MTRDSPHRNFASSSLDLSMPDLIHQPTAPTRAPLSDSPPAAAEQRLITIGFLLLGGAFLWLYLPTFRWLLGLWGYDEYYAHGPFLPFISAYLIYLRRDELRLAWQKRPGVGALPSGLIFLALAMHICGSFSEMNSVRALQAFSIPVFLLGVARTLGGAHFARLLRFSLLFFCLAVPMSGPMVSNFTIPLQNYAASFSAMLLGLLGMPITRDGLNLYTPLYHFIVAVPCSGLKTGITLFTMGVLIAHLMPNLNQMQRTALCLISIPVALLANTLRVMAIVTLGFHYGPKVAEGFLHSGSGLFMFSLSLGALIGTGVYLGKTSGAAASPISAPATSPANQPPAEVAALKTAAPRRVFTQQLLIAGLMAGAFGVGMIAIPRVETESRRVPRLQLADAVAGWRGRDSKIAPSVTELLRPTAILQKRYTLNRPAHGSSSSLPPAEVEALVIYNRDISELHMPEICMRVAGWQISNRVERRIESGGKSLNITVLTGEQREQRKLIAYAFSDETGAVAGRTATFANLMLSRLLRQQKGALEIQFAYDSRVLTDDGDFTPQFKALMLQTAETIYAQMKANVAASS